MRFVYQAIFVCAACVCQAAVLCAQELPYNAPPGGFPAVRPAPGEHASYDNQRGGSVIGARPGSLRPRVPFYGRQRGPAHVAPTLQPLPSAELAQRPARVPNAWSLLFEIEDDGPPDGLTWDQALDRLTAASISLRARALDIPQAQADVLTAGMHANPVVYMDGQLLPYRPYNLVSNPGGPAQYDVNVAYPVDFSGKRQARVDVACAAKRVVEALYQDAIRQEIDRLGNAYIDALAARLAVRTVEDGLARIDAVEKQPHAPPHDAREAESARRQLQLQRHTAALALLDAESVLRSTKRNLAMFLNLPPTDAAKLQLRGTLRDRTPPPPVVADLVSSALANRPDLTAYRLGLERAQADTRLSKANKWPDAFLLYQPFTWQDNSPYNAPGSSSWAVGATMTLPIFDRNQGNIRRAEVNVDQSQLEMQALERRVVTEVESAYDEYASTRLGIEQIERELLPNFEKTRGESFERLRQGRVDAANYLNAQRDLDDLGRHYHDLIIRHRRSMLTLNTAVGVRIFP